MRLPNDASEIVAEASSLTWDNLIEAIRKSGVAGITNNEIRALFKARLGRVEHLTLIMWESGAIRRLKIEDGLAWRYHL